MRRYGGLLVIVLLLTPGRGLAAPQVAQHPRQTSLAPGCIPLADRLPMALSPRAVQALVTPPEAVQALWVWDAARGRFRGFFPAAPSASDLAADQPANGYWLCLTAPAQLGLPASSGPQLRCVLQPLPLGIAASGWTVQCTLQGAAPTDTGFTVSLTALPARVVCSGRLAGGAGSCGGRLLVALDEPLPSLGLTAMLSPSGVSVSDPTPIVQPLRAPGPAAAAALTPGR
jgi:hypothetical protein